MRRYLVFAVLMFGLLGTAFAGGGQEAAAQDDGPVRIVYSQWDYELENQQYSRDVVAAFQELHPDYEIEVIDASSNEYDDKITIMLSAGSDLDLIKARGIDTLSGHVQRHQATDLTPYVADMDLTPYGDTIGQMSYDGKLYGLPFRVDYHLMFYNIDLFNAMGVALPTNDWTWTDFREAARQLAQGTPPNRTYGTLFHPRLPEIVMPALLKTGETLNSVDYNDLRAGLELVYAMENTDNTAQDFATNISTGAHYRRDFYKGNIGMVCNGIWNVSLFSTDGIAGNHNVNWGIVQMPEWEGQGDNTISVVTPMLINSASENKDAAFEMLQFMTSRDAARIMARHLMSTAFSAEPEILAIYMNADILPENVKRDITNGAFETERMQEYISGADIASNMIEDMVTEELSLYFTSNVTLDECIQSMTERREEIYDSIN